MNDIQKKIQSLLFWKNEPMTFKELSKLLEVDSNTVESEAKKLSEILKDEGIVLVVDGEEMRLATNQNVSELINNLEKAERSKELSKAALETLAIILYKGPIRRSDVDYIRGVNSQFIVRHLEIRGLIEKEQSITDARVFMYKATLDLLAHLGVQSREDLPEFDVLTKKLEEASAIQNENQEESTDERV